MSVSTRNGGNAIKMSTRAGKQPGVNMNLLTEKTDKKQYEKITVVPQ